MFLRLFLYFLLQGVIAACECGELYTKYKSVGGLREHMFKHRHLTFNGRLMVDRYPGLDPFVENPAIPEDKLRLIFCIGKHTVYTVVACFASTRTWFLRISKRWRGAFVATCNVVFCWCAHSNSKANFTQICYALDFFLFFVLNCFPGNYICPNCGKHFKYPWLLETHCRTCVYGKAGGKRSE